MKTKKDLMRALAATVIRSADMEKAAAMGARIGKFMNEQGPQRNSDTIMTLAFLLSSKIKDTNLEPDEFGGMMAIILESVTKSLGTITAKEKKAS